MATRQEEADGIAELWRLNYEEHPTRDNQRKYWIAYKNAAKVRREEDNPHNDWPGLDY